MKKLLILSGKGGTGKTTTAAAFIDFSKANFFADCDVDAPNLHLVTEFSHTPLNYAYTEKEFIGSKKAFINSEKCTGCSICNKHCKFNAISMISITNKQTAIVNEMLCEGCGVCSLVCPSKAISLNDDKAGDIKIYITKKYFVTAQLKMGRGNSGKLVSSVKKTLDEKIQKEKISNNSLEIIDGSPGIGCPVIASVGGMDFVLIVTEPSLSGISDMKRILQTVNYFGIKAGVCVNKADTCKTNTKIIENYCKKNNIFFAGKIPYDEHILEAVNNNKSIANISCKASNALLDIYKKIIRLLAK